MSDTPITKLSSLDITPDPNSKYNGFYLPQLTNAERDAIPADALRNGGLIYNITTDKINAYVDEAWVSVATDELLSKGAKEVSEKVINTTKAVLSNKTK
jgi:hypothetical protein